MTISDEFAEMFYFDPAAPRMVCAGANVSIARDNQANAIAVCAELLSRSDKTPSGKSLWMQLQPVDALILAASIFAHAKEKGWDIPPNLLVEIETTQLSPGTKKH